VLTRRPQSVRRAYQQIDGTEAFLFHAKSFANTSLDAVTVAGKGGMFAGNQNSESRLTRTPPLDIEGITAEVASLPLAQQSLELRLAPQSALRVEEEALWRGVDFDYSARRRRPRARRLRSTLRPPGVRLRTRKPWRRARRVFEGW
jgi:hypothetical protein